MDDNNQRGFIVINQWIRNLGFIHFVNNQKIGGGWTRIVENRDV